MSSPGTVFVCHRDNDCSTTAAASTAAAAAASEGLVQRIQRLGYFGHTLYLSPRTPPTPSLSSAATVVQQKQDDNATGASSHVRVQCHVRTRIPSEFGHATHSLLLYSNTEDSEEHLALVFGYSRTSPGGIWSKSLEAVIPGETSRDRIIRGASQLEPSTDFPPSPTGELSAPLARIHSCCFTGETLGSLRCDCREQLIEAMKLMGSESRGVILYLKQEGRGIGLRDKMRAYNLIDQGYDTLEANIELGHPSDARSYQIATAILRDLQIPAVRLLTNNPHKVKSIVADGVVVSERVPMVPASWANGAEDAEVQDRDGYLVTKVQRMGHILDIPEEILSGTKTSPNLKRKTSQRASPDSASKRTK
ncbi:GTP cyclohydrolase II [Entophlyctis luteolus]|nr:GTP cyclohydrolase II [Entophlyctis luteolus]KAJ3354686.1 GTP cyclohydrolase II [Entophlyctis luteolus]